MENNNDYIPLFLHIEEPIATFIIDNKLIGCQEWVGYERSPDRAFSLLLQLFSNFDTQTEFPKCLHKYFLAKEIKKIERPDHCLIGTDFTFAMDSFACLELLARIDSKEEKSVILYNFAYENVPFSLDIELLPKDAFHIFANICTNTRCVTYQNILLENKMWIFDKKLILKYLGSKNYTLLPIDNFILDYIEYLRASILKNKLVVDDILKMSGNKLLVLLLNDKPVQKFIKKIIDIFLSKYDNLSLNQKVMYYTFLISINDIKPSLSPIVKEFFDENPDLVNKLVNDVEFKFPERETINEIFHSYRC